MLIGRDKQKAILLDSLKSKKSEFVVTFGRRRIGKTFLIWEVLGQHFDFEMTGIKDGSMEDQLQNFTAKLGEFGFGNAGTPKPTTWMEAFALLRQHLTERKGNKRKVIFIDELSWIATPRSKFIGMLGHFWNDYAVRNNVLLVVCGSAASWMIDKVLNDKGGLHNRATQYIPLQPFNLGETEQFLIAKNIKATRHQIAQLYMALGGVPYYLDLLKPSESIVQNINRLCFDDLGFLRGEFDRLYQSLFKNAENHLLIVKALASKWQGMSQSEIAKATKLSQSGRLVSQLDELEKSAFIERYVPFGKQKKGTLYRLTDNFSLFHLKFINERGFKNQKAVFSKLFSQPEYRAWSGYAFETICLMHKKQIAEALGITYILHEFSTFSVSGKEKGENMQIDLLIDRSDGVINLCEAKFFSQFYMLEAAEKQKLQNRAELFSKFTKTKKTVLTTLITPYGLQQHENHADVVQNVVVLDDLFKNME